MSTREIADTLGVSQPTVIADQNLSAELDSAPQIELPADQNLSSDLQQTELVDAIEAKAPNHAEQVRLARIAKEFATALHAVSSLPLLQPDDVWAACTRIEIESAEGTLQSAIRWLKNVQRRGIHVV